MKTSTILYGLFFTLFSTQLYAQGNQDIPQKRIKKEAPFHVRWELQITDPEFELKYYKLDDKAYKAFLPKTSWRCNTTETQKRGQIELKKLFCDYSVEKAGTVRTTVSCSPERPYSEAVLEIYDEKKDLTFHIMLNCRKQ